MPRFPVYERQVGLSGGATASYASEGAFTAPGRAVEGLGDTLASVGSQLEAAERKRAEQDAKIAAKFEETRDTAWFSKARAESVAALRGIEAEVLAEPGTAVQTITENSGAYFAEKAAEAPSTFAAELFHTWAGGYSATSKSVAATAQAAAAITTREQNFRTAVSLHADYVRQFPEELAGASQRLADDLVAAGQWMSPDQHKQAQAEAETMLVDAYGNALLERDPDGLLEMLEEGEAPFTGDSRQFFHDAAVERIEAREREIAQAEYSAEGNAFIETFGQVASGNVDIEWLEANRDILGEDGYHAALGEGVAKLDRTDPADPNWRDNLLSLSLTDPEQALFTAWDYYSQRMLSRETFAMIHANAMDAETQEGRNRNKSRQYLASQLPEGEGRIDVFRQFEAYLEKNPNADAIEIDDYADRLATAFRKSVKHQTISKMPRPRYAPPVAKPDAATMEKAKQNTAKKLSDGAITAKEAAKEAGLIRRWLKAMELFDD